MNICLKKYNVELIISENAYFIADHELDIKLEHNKEVIKSKILDFIKKQDRSEFLKVWLNDELWANPASGSFKTNGMIISPCSMSTLASIAQGLSSNLIERASDVVIKEGRKLVLVPRETPLSAIHLENMFKLSKLGVKIVPPMPGFYGKMDTVEDIIEFSTGKTLDAFGIDNNLYRRWEYEK